MNLSAEHFAHLVLLETQANLRKTKRAIFAHAQKDRTTIIQTLFILKNKIVEKLNLS